MAKKRMTDLGTSSSSYGECEELGRVLVAIKFQLGERRSMTLNRLTDTPVPTVQLHGALDLESGWVRRIASDTNKYEPFLVRAGTVVDDLRADEGRMAIKHLLRG